MYEIYGTHNRRSTKRKAFCNILNDIVGTKLKEKRNQRGEDTRALGNNVAAQTTCNYHTKNAGLKTHYFIYRLYKRPMTQYGDVDCGKKVVGIWDKRKDTKNSEKD